MNPFSKDELIKNIKAIRNRGWILNHRSNSDGGAGNTLEDLLGIEENNLPIPNAGEWELKCQVKTTSLVTLFHCEPSPKGMKFVANILLPTYGWRHKFAGTKYPVSEKSFQQTINTQNFSSRGFSVKCNDEEKKIEIMFQHNLISSENSQWAGQISQNNAEILQVNPYWGFQDLSHILGYKMHNCFYVIAEKKKEGGVNYLRYNTIYKLEASSSKRFFQFIRDGHVYVDFNARTGHNHGSKYRIKQNYFHALFDSAEEIK